MPVLIWLLPIAALGAAGCSPGIAWRGYMYEPVIAASVQENKLTFVYFRSAYSVECTRFEENVLKDPQVRGATSDLNCVALEYVWDADLAAKWGLRKPPAIALVTPVGEALATREGEAPVDAVLAAINEAKSLFAQRNQALPSP